ncbi:Hypothetical_protein [Hexamita inflata]|uniref:Hypothetical_protein n=1 Tax=Hexamita inflata TaxID=28002 RepID=A0AA86NA06_9EUKA|nr:Hypothetical protein HINF_LOCUS3155 [Hexamita inflata]
MVFTAFWKAQFSNIVKLYGCKAFVLCFTSSILLLLLAYWYKHLVYFSFVAFIIREFFQECSNALLYCQFVIWCIDYYLLEYVLYFFSVVIKIFVKLQRPGVEIVVVYFYLRGVYQNSNLLPKSCL